MKKSLFAFPVALVALSAAAQYSVNWHTIDGGGGTSAGGGYSVSGTIGQADASRELTSKRYSLAGGFWSLLAVSSLSGPRLTIVCTGTNTAVVSWPASAGDHQLQYNTNLDSTNWIAVGEMTHDNGSEKFILVNPVVGHRFFRMFKP